MMVWFWCDGWKEEALVVASRLGGSSHCYKLGFELVIYKSSGDNSNMPYNFSFEQPLKLEVDYCRLQIRGSQ